MLQKKEWQKRIRPIRAQECLGASAMRDLSPAEAFAATIEGRTLVKPKFINDPDTGRLYRLVVRTQGEHRYAELPLETQKTYALELGEKAKRRYESSPADALQPPYHIKTFKYNTRYPINLPEISFRQTQTVLFSLSRPHRWSVTEEECYHRNNPYIVNVLFDGERIIGLRMWDKSTLHSDHTVDVGFFLIHPDYQGKGLGRHLLDFTNRQILRMDPSATLSLHTSEVCMDAHNAPAKDFYLRNGYTVKKEEPFDYELYRKAITQEAPNALCVPVNVPESFFHDPKTKEELPRFSKERIDAQLGQAASQLLASRTHAR